MESLVFVPSVALDALAPEGTAPWISIVIIIVAFFASAITAALGLGGGIVLLIVMGTLLPAAAVIPLHGVAQMGANFSRAALNARWIRWSIIGWFALGAVAGSLVGAGFLRAVYPPFWRRELDVEDPAVVEASLAVAGVPVKGFAEFVGGEGGARHDDLQSQLHPVGIYGVPTYVFDGDRLFGREHLPYVRWHLTGRSGPAPDIAYEVAT